LKCAEHHKIFSSRAPNRQIKASGQMGSESDLIHVILILIVILNCFKYEDDLKTRAAGNLRRPPLELFRLI
jgi:hypothetical protein